MSKDKFVYSFIDLYNKSLSDLHRSGVNFGDSSTQRYTILAIDEGDSLGYEILNSSLRTYAVTLSLATLLAALTVVSILQFLNDTRILNMSGKVELSFKLPDTEANVVSPLEYSLIDTFSLDGARGVRSITRANKYYFPRYFTDLRELPPVADLDMANPVAVPVYHAPVYTELDFSGSSRSPVVPDLLLAIPDAKLPPPIILPPVPIYSINILGLGDIQVDVIVSKAKSMSYNYSITRNEFDNYNLFRVYKPDARGRYNVNTIRATLVGEFNLIEDAIIYANSISGDSFINEEQIITGLTDIVICCVTLEKAQKFAQSMDSILLNRPIYLARTGYR